MPVFPSGLEDENLRRVERSIINLSGQHLPDNNNNNNNNNINMSNSGNVSNMKLLYSDEKNHHSAVPDTTTAITAKATTEIMIKRTTLNPTTAVARTLT